MVGHFRDEFHATGHQLGRSVVERDLSQVNRRFALAVKNRVAGCAQGHTGDGFHDCGRANGWDRIEDHRELGNRRCGPEPQQRYWRKQRGLSSLGRTSRAYYVRVACWVACVTVHGLEPNELPGPQHQKQQQQGETKSDSARRQMTMR